MPLSEHELARRTGDRLDLRPDPMRVRWRFDELVTSDGHDARCTFECSARAVDNATERRMLQEVLMNGHAAITAEDVTDQFERALHDALTKVTDAAPIADLLNDTKRDVVISALRAAGDRVAFACGLELLAPFNLDIESPSLQQQRLRDMQRGLAERQAAGQVEHFQRAAELLKQFQAIRASAPELSAGQVLERITPSDRGSVLQTLLLASATEARGRHLWAVAGPYLVQIDARATPPKTELTPLPPTLGPLRSIQPATIDGERVLLVGARSGIMRIKADTLDSPEIYADPQVTSQLGFSRVIFAGNALGLAACHGEAGIVRWTLGRTSEPAFRLANEELRQSYPSAGASATARNLQPLGEDKLVFSFGNMLLGLDGDSNAFVIPTASAADIIAIVPDERRLLVVHDDGTVCGIDRASFEITCKQRTGHRIAAAGGLPWLGSTRLLLATEDGGAVQCVGLDDPLVTQYGSDHRGLRAVAGSADVVAGVSADRQRLILWNTWDGKQPAAEIYLTGVTRHRIADVDFG
jgi:hypothetical protein